VRERLALLIGTAHSVGELEPGLIESSSGAAAGARAAFCERSQ